MVVLSVAEGLFNFILFSKDISFHAYPEISDYVCVLIESLIYIEIQW